MKKLHILLISLMILTGTAVSKSAAAQEGYYRNANFRNFYNELSPYGRWVNVPRYGTVWVYNEPGFRPYATNGQWENTDMGWTWQSDYEWGGIPFHYGRWEMDPYYGWVWIPGYDYAPAWVTWSEADDYYGWAPLGFGMDINISIGRIPSNRWMYAERGYMGRSRIDNYCVPYDRNRFYYERQRPVGNIYTHNNVRYFGGPKYDNQNYNNGRPSVRQEQYSNYGSRPSRAIPGNTRPDNNGNNSNGNNIHFDPATHYQRDRAIAAERPERQNAPSQVQERPNLEQRRIDNGQRPAYHDVPQQRNPAPAAPVYNQEQVRSNNQDRMDQERMNQQRVNQEQMNQQRASQERMNQQRVSQERVNNNNQPQARESSRSESNRNNNSPGGRPMITKDRRIY